MVFFPVYTFTMCSVVYDIGDDQAITHIGDDSWHVVGQQLSMHNSFWGLPTDDPTMPQYSNCVVVGYAGRYKFPSGAASPHTYIIECEGHHYPARHSTVAGALTDAAVKRRIKKAAKPRLL